MKYKTSGDREFIKSHDYKTAKIKGFKTLSQLELPSNFYGGRVHRIAELKDSPNMLILDHLNNVIDILLPNEDKRHICDNCNKEFTTPLGLGSHKRHCKKLGEV